MAAVDIAHETPANAWWTRRRRITAAVAAVLVAGVAVAAVIFVNWLHSLKVPIGSSFGFGITRPVGATFYLPGVIDPETDRSVTVDLRSITAHIRTNTADATVTVLTCVQTGEIAVVGSPKLPSCRDAKPFRAGTLRLADRRGADGLAVRITLRHPGRLVIDGFTFTYRDGIRTGNGRSDVIITAKAVAPGS